jgi:hypothetical protein
VNYRQGNKRVDAVGAGAVAVEPVPDPGSIPPAFRTYSSTPVAERAQYARSGEQFAIWGGGRDLSGWVDERATLYRDAPADSTVVARLVDQQGGGPVAKAGIAVANDLTTPAKGGYAVLVMTAGHGPEFMWDGNGDGKLDGWAGGGATTHPSWLKLVRAGTTYTAYTSDDGSTWREVGSATVPSAAASGSAHVGMVASAANVNHPGKIVRAVVDRFEVSP